MYTEPFPFGKWVGLGPRAEDLARVSLVSPRREMGTYTSYPIFSTGEDRLVGSWLALLVRFSYG